MTFMRRRGLVFVMLAVIGAASVQGHASCLEDDPILVCPSRTQTGAVTDGKVWITNPTNCPVKVSITFSAGTTNCCGENCDQYACSTTNGPWEFTIEANDTIVVNGGGLPNSCNINCDLPHGTWEAVILLEAILTEGKVNGQWMTYDTPCTTTPITATEQHPEAGPCCEIPFGPAQP